jgi:hypothetical protein
MPALRKTASMSTTLSIFTTKKGKYQKVIGIVNVYFMISSLTMLIMGALLIGGLHMDKIYVPSDEGILDSLWSYGTLPWLLVGIGIATFVVATLGFLFLELESKPPLIVYSCLLGLLVISQFYFVYVTIDANNKIAIDSQKLIQNDLEKAMKLYLKVNDSTFRDNWNTIQRDFRCCGFLRQGGDDYRTLSQSDLHDFTIVADNRCVPESCCINDEQDSGGVLCQRRELGKGPRQNCGSTAPPNQLNEWKMKQLNVRPCPHVIQEMYGNLVPKLFVLIGILGGLNILVEVITITLALSFVAQITRRAKRYEIANDMEMD